MLVAVLGRLQVTRYKQDSGGPCRTCSGRRYQRSATTPAAGPPGERAAEGSGVAASLTRSRRRTSMQRQRYACEIYFQGVISVYKDTRCSCNGRRFMAFFTFANVMDVSFDLLDEISRQVNRPTF